MEEQLPQKGKRFKKAVIIIVILLVLLACLVFAVSWFKNGNGPGNIGKVKMPDVTGMYYQDAEEYLRQRGFTNVGYVWYFGSGPKKEDVLKVTQTNPPAGEWVSKKDEIYLYIQEYTPDYFD